MKTKWSSIIAVISIVALMLAVAVLPGCAPPPVNTTTKEPENKTAESSEAPSQQTTSEEATSASSTASATLTGVALGTKIYATGVDNTGKIAFTGGKAGITTGACVRCHGVKAVGGIGPNIQGKTLKPAFDETTFARAVTQGLDEAGKPLKATMPRFKTTAEDNSALWAYLNTLP